MKFSEEQVEWIVLEVLRRLEALRVPGDARSSSPAAELTVTDRVVTMRSIDGKLNGVSRLRVQPRAVITPAVKDELKKRKIELIVQTR